MKLKYEVWLLHYGDDEFIYDEELSSFENENDALTFARGVKLIDHKMFDYEDETRIQVEAHYQEYEDAGCDECLDLIYEDSMKWEE